MEELRKVRRVIHKAQEGAPHETWLVVDSTTGQNAIQQAKLFKEAMEVTGIVLTKLDGTAKGGVILGICDELKPCRCASSGSASRSTPCGSSIPTASSRAVRARSDRQRRVIRGPSPCCPL